MKIHLVVEEFEANPDYKHGSLHRYEVNFPPMVDPIRLTRRLDIEVTEDEWKAIKKAVIEVM